MEAFFLLGAAVCLMLLRSCLFLMSVGIFNDGETAQHTLAPVLYSGQTQNYMFI